MRRAELRFRSLRDLAKAAGINVTTIHNFWKSDRKAFPYANDAVRIARALGTSVEYLVTGEGISSVEQDPHLEEIVTMLEGRPKDQLIELRGVIRSYLDTHFKEEQKTGT